MCLGVPAKVLEIFGNKEAVVEFGGIKRRISVAMVPDVKIGDFVIVHAGFAISKVDEVEANEERKLWDELIKVAKREGKEI